MTEVQITRWREIPSLITARDGDEIVKVPLPPRFQEAIDEAAMRMGSIDSDAYLQGWVRGDWEPVKGSASEAADAATIDIEALWDVAALQAHVDSFGPAESGSAS